MAKKKRRIQKPDKGAYLPSRKEIAARCREIQGEWSEKEKLKRYGLCGLPEWTVPEVHINGGEDTGEDGSRQGSFGEGGSDARSDSF